MLALGGTLIKQIFKSLYVPFVFLLEGLYWTGHVDGIPPDPAESALLCLGWAASPGVGSSTSRHEFDDKHSWTLCMCSVPE